MIGYEQIKVIVSHRIQILCQSCTFHGSGQRDDDIQHNAVWYSFDLSY